MRWVREVRWVKFNFVEKGGERDMPNEYFELVEDKDLDAEEYKVQGWVWYCPECNAIFGSKAIYARTIFPWFGYHPNDGNCKVISEDTARSVRDRADECKCKSSIKRVRSRKLLEMLIESHKM